MNVGIIGFGKMGQIRADVATASNQVTVTKVFDPYPPKDLKGYTLAASAEEIINDPDIGAVFISTPNVFNRDFTIGALRQGKHVFCEKPPACTYQDVEAIREVEKETGLKLMYGFNHRHHKSIQTIKSHIDNKNYGKVLWMRGRYGKSVDQDFFNTWRANRKLAGGGILLDQGIHMLDLFLYLGGTFDDVHAFVSKCYWQSEIEDNVFAILRNTETGVTASLHSTMTQWRHLFSLEIFLSKGYMVINGLKTSSGTYGDEVLSIAKNRSTAPAATWEDEEVITYHTDKSWQSEFDHFMECIENDTPVVIGNSHDALEIMKLIDTVYSSDPMSTMCLGKSE